VQDQRRRRK
jgi:hypothetical protein